MNKRKQFSLKAHEDCVALDLAANCTELSKSHLKKLFTAGAVWLKDSRSQRVLRRVKTNLKKGDILKIYFDPNIKPFDMELIKCVHDTHNWGIWYKPPGLLTQGTKYGDEFTLLRYVEKKLNTHPVLVHRLDRETGGLIILAYNRKSARYFSEIIRNREVTKIYQAEVKGILENDKGEIDSPVDDKQALSRYQVIKRNEDSTFVEVEIITGRKHQIRVHMDELGHPVLGDHLYGEDNSHPDGLRLRATKLSFKEPSRQKEMSFELEGTERLF